MKIGDKIIIRDNVPNSLTSYIWAVGEISAVDNTGGVVSSDGKAVVYCYFNEMIPYKEKCAKIIEILFG